jgi:hypothetical protein
MRIENPSEGSAVTSDDSSQALVFESEIRQASSGSSPLLLAAQTNPPQGCSRLPKALHLAYSN